jgi:hypothetical protein
MSRDNSLPFERGTTAYQGTTPDASNLKFAELLGCIKEHEDRKFQDTGGVKGVNSPHMVTVMAVRNETGGAVTPGQAVELDPENPFAILRTAQSATIKPVIVDEFLPSAGCPDDDVCWVVIHGPCLAKVAPGNVADQAGGTYWIGDGTSKGVLVPYVAADDKAIAAFHAAVGAAWNMVTIAQAAGTVDGRVFIRSKYLS